MIFMHVLYVDSNYEIKLFDFEWVLNYFKWVSIDFKKYTRKKLNRVDLIKFVCDVQGKWNWN